MNCVNINSLEDIVFLGTKYHLFRYIGDTCAYTAVNRPYDDAVFNDLGIIDPPGFASRVLHSDVKRGYMWPSNTEEEAFRLMVALINYGWEHGFVDRIIVRKSVSLMEKLKDYGLSADILRIKAFTSDSYVFSKHPVSFREFTAYGYPTVCQDGPYVTPALFYTEGILSGLQKTEQTPAVNIKIKHHNIKFNFNN